MHASCRAADEFWPPSDVAPPPDTQLSLGAEHSLLLQPRALKPGVTLGDERPVISIVAEGGLLSYGQVRLSTPNSKPLLCPESARVTLA